PQIEVTFDLDANGILHVSAKDLGTNKEAKIEIKGSSGLDPTEVERMKKEADAHAAETKRKVELINARNEADARVFALEKLLKDSADKISENDKAPILAAIEKVKHAMSGEDVNAIKQAISEMEQASHAMAQHLYGKGPGGGPAAGGPSGD